MRFSTHAHFALTPQPRRWVRAGLWLGLVLLAAGSLFWLRRDGPRYDTLTVSRGDVQAHVTAIGTLQPRRYVDVGAQVSGQVNRLHVQPGAEVKKGQLLVEIDPSVQQATVDGGRAALTGLRAQLADQQAQHWLASQQYARQKALAQIGATRLEDAQIAEATLASAAAKIDNLKAQIDQTQATLKADEARLGYTRIYAPMSGTVVSLEAREGQTLNATYQTPNILRIADLSAMTVWTEVSEADVRRVKPGMAVYFTTLGSHEDATPRRWSGSVRQVLPAPPLADNKGSGSAAPAATKAVAYTVLFDVDNSDGELMPQMTAQASFITAQAQNVVAVPLTALTVQPAVPGQPARYTARVLRPDGSVDTRDVQVAVRSRHLVEVRQGLQEGELLVTGERSDSDGATWFQL
jgi:membrane fusion protein, macrolide-specific efflux system